MAQELSALDFKSKSSFGVLAEWLPYNVRDETQLDFYGIELETSLITNKLNIFLP